MKHLYLELHNILNKEDDETKNLNPENMRILKKLSCFYCFGISGEVIVILLNNGKVEELCLTGSDISDECVSQIAADKLSLLKILSLCLLERIDIVAKLNFQVLKISHCCLSCSYTSDAICECLDPGKTRYGLIMILKTLPSFPLY